MALARLLLYKKDGDVVVAAMGEPEFGLLRALSRGRTLERAFDLVLKSHGDLEPAKVNALFGILAEAGVRPVRP